MASSFPIERNLNAGIGATVTHSCSNSSRISRQWSDLNYDLLLSIFSRLSSADLIVGVSFVCSSWRSAAGNKLFWRVLDLSDWDSLAARIPVRVTFNRVLNSVLGFVRESEVIEEIYFPRVANERHLVLVSQRLPKLVYLSFPRSKVRKPAAAYSALSNFKSLKGIAVHKHFLEIETSQFRISKFPNLSDLKLLGDSGPLDYAITTICTLFPMLRKLDMPLHFVTDMHAIVSLIDSLEHLEYIDLSGCRTGTNKIFIELESRAKEVSVVFPDGMTANMIRELFDTI